MATNQDFDDLITRIDAATDTLEVATTTIVNAGSDVAEQVQLAQQAAATATTQAGNSATSATAAANSATLAGQKATEAQAAVDEAKALAPFDEAPLTGQTYGRNNGDWVAVGSAEGAVTSVNGITPDAEGNVTLSIPDAQVNSDWNATSGVAQILNKPTLFSGDYNDLTNKPTIPDSTSDLTNDSGFIADAPSDGKQYARKNATWAEVAAAGLSELTDAGVGSEGGFIFNNTNKALNILHYMTAINFDSITSGTINGLFNGVDSIKYLPAGIYRFHTDDYTGAPLAGREGLMLCVETVNWSSTGTARTGAAANKSVIAMSWVVGGAIQWHVWTGANTWITLT